ncbi:MAG: mandelate racemase/muconate lactonizing enzyme family protein [Bacteroidetes bacterium]|nr:mandelate racemase/muconate lactonizing enzyme family protein [Bacteroidota bacterium]
MKITNVQASIHRIPVQVPLLSEPINRELVFVRLETDEGITGYGMTSQILRFSVREFINRELGPFLRDRNALDTERLWTEMYTRFNQRGTSGAVQAGISAVDIALWDAKGKYFSQPVWRLLGGNSSSVPAYITFGLPDFDRDQLVEVAKQYVNEGQDKLKMVVADQGWKSVAEDVPRVKAVREAIGDDVQLMVDANQLLDYRQALELCYKIEPYDIAWFEEPIFANDVRELAELRRHTRIPISAGQNEGHKWRHRDLIVGGAVDIVQPNVVYVGGYTEAVKVAHLAQAFSLPIANGGGWPHHNAHLHAAVSNGWRVEFHYVMWKASEAIFQNAPWPDKGWVHLTEEPGLGMEPREDVLKDSLQQ